MLLAPTRQDPASGPPSPDRPDTGEGAGARAAGRDGAQAMPGASGLCQHLAAADALADGVRRLADWVRREAGASAVHIGWYERGHIQLAPETPAADPKAWTDAMEEALDQGQALSHRPGQGASASDEWVTRSQQILAQALGAHVVTLVLPGPAVPLGALTLARPLQDAGWRDEEVQAWQALMSQAAPVLAWQQRSGRPWHWHVRAALLQTWQRSRKGARTHPRRALVAVAVAVSLLAVVPLPDKVSGQARIEGAQQRVLVATSDGFIKQVHAQPGDTVKAGQVLADLAEQDLRLEREKWTSQIAQQDNAYAAAMTRADRSEAALALSRLEEAQAQLALVDEQLQRTQLRAPFDGVLIQGDLSQSVGAPVKQGDTLMTVASTQRWRVMIEIDEGDIGRVHIGQTGEMALSALPWDTLPIRVRRITPLAQAREGRNLFEVEAEFTARVPRDVRPGLLGQAKVQVGHAPLLWRGVRPLVERIRLGLWSWWG
ncbi:MAG: efflux RND transporter periplasmic adaptor subunit [Aquabacterium sp.]